MMNQPRPDPLSWFPLHTFGLLVVAAALVLTGCDRSDGTVLEAIPDEPTITVERQSAGGDDAHSRVFDGRDSLRTGLGGPTATKDNFTIVTQFIQVQGDDGLVDVTDPGNLRVSTALFESRAGKPILAPDSEHVTWGQFSSARGAVIVKCTRRGTHVVVHLSDLIPKGVYSIQNKLVEPGSNELLGQIGFSGTNGKGASKGARKAPSSFRASASGEGHLSGVVQPGALDEIGTCILDDVTAGAYDWHTVAIYQIDGTPGLDAAGTYVEQAGFVFETENADPPRDVE